jgi:hypothetical protein
MKKEMRFLTINLAAHQATALVLELVSSLSSLPSRHLPNKSHKVLRKNLLERGMTIAEGRVN